MGKPQSTGNLVNALAQDSSNNIGIGGAANASFKLQVTGATNLTGALSGTSAALSSTATATAFIPSGSSVPTNGMYLPSANTLGFATNGTLDMVINAAGNVAIGTSTPFNSVGYTVLDLYGSSVGGHFLVRSPNVTAEYLANDILGEAYIGTRTNHPIIFRTNTTTRLTIASTGAATFSSSVTANSTINGYLSTITGGQNPATSGTTPTNPMLNLTNNRGVGLYVGGQHASPFGIWMQVADTSNLGAYYPLLLQPNGGNVGIGTSSPQNRLTVNTPLRSDGETNSLGAMVVAGAISSSASNDFTNSTAIFRVQGNNATNSLQIGVGSEGYNFNPWIQGSFDNSSGGGSDFGAKAILLNPIGGNVGIGVSDPIAGVLQVNKATNSQIAIVNTNVGTSWLGISSTDMVMAVESGSLIFKTGCTFPTGISTGTERMRITSAGNLTIGFAASVDDCRVYIRGADTGGTNNGLLIQNSSGTNTLRVRNDGAFYTGVAANSPVNLTTGSAANVFVESGSGLLYRSTSSLKYKKNVENYTKGLAEVMQMRPVTYNSKSENETQTYAGLIAEEIHELGLTEFVQYAEDGSPDALAYSNMVSLLVKAVQELKAEIDELKNK